MGDYWSIDATGLDEEDAKYLARAAAELPSVLVATPLDPRLWLTRHLDADTVQTIVRGLEVAIGSGQVPENDRQDIHDVIDDFDEWLSRSDEESRS
ncbi:hypothetical protein [Agromyces salentinus]|uniref:Uncharacterized protein n=1 Tax=Agromyces salentinus TaxID=269421 RepID=A0ABN2N0W3_9MICO|nr:hypothetical protein [Agromyces salentinus]